MLLLILPETLTSSSTRFTDFACSAPSFVWQSLLKLCQPVYWLMTNSGMFCGCGNECDVWHHMENFVYEHGHLPFPPYTKYHRMFERQPAELKGEGDGNLDEDRNMALYKRDDPPQYATPS